MTTKKSLIGKKILVTGATGFLGASCLDFLSELGYEAIGVSSKTQQQTIVKLDLLNKASVTFFFKKYRPTHLLHLAWYTEPPDYWNSDLNLKWHEASIHLLQCFYHSGGKRAVVSGTCAEYEWGHEVCIEGKTPCKPTSLYGAAKLSLSILSEKIAEKEKGSIAWARLFHLFGPRESPKRLIPLVIQGLLEKRVTPCSHGNQIRDYLYVKDAASALVELLNSDIEGPINIGSGKHLKIRDIIDLISEKIGNHSLIQLGGISGNLDPIRLVPQLTRLTDELGWKPKIDIELALEKTISWWNNINF